MINKINAKDVSLIVYDFDGVMTDNKVLVFSNGEEAVFCNRSDGLAVSEIKKLGIEQLIVSTEKSEIVMARAKKLGVKVLYGVDNKRDSVREYCSSKKINLEKVVYIGNDINDLEVMKIVGYPVAPANAEEEIKKIAKFIIKKEGGNGAIREFLNMLY